MTMPGLQHEPSEAETKGTNFIGTLRSLEEMRGRPVHGEVVAALPGAMGEALRHGQILAIGWYPLSWYVALQLTIQEVSGEGMAITRALATKTTARDFTALHRVLVQVLSTKTVARHAHRLVQLYWRGGAIDVLPRADHEVLVRYTNWRGADLVIWEDLAASTQAVLRLVGGDSASARVVAVSADRRSADIDTSFA